MKNSIIATQIFDHYPIVIALQTRNQHEGEAISNGNQCHDTHVILRKATIPI